MRSSTEWSNHEEMKRERYGEIFQRIPDVLFILSGAVKNIAHPSAEPVYVSTSYSDSDQYGMLAGKMRVDAAAEVSRYLPDTKLVTTSHGPSPDSPNHLTVIHAYIQASELRRLGIFEERIITEIRSIDTLTELQEMAKLIARHRWHSVGILTFELHAERVGCMLSHLEDLSGIPGLELKAGLEYVAMEKPSLVIIKAEDILWHVSSHYRCLIEYARNTPSYQRRLASEKKGVEAIQNKTYLPTGETKTITSDGKTGAAITSGIMLQPPSAPGNQS